MKKVVVDSYLFGVYIEANDLIVVYVDDHECLWNLLILGKNGYYFAQNDFNDNALKAQISGNLDIGVNMRDFRDIKISHGNHRITVSSNGKKVKEENWNTLIDNLPIKEKKIVKEFKLEEEFYKDDEDW